eukprot:GHRR01023938.1.p1 GENE.GHRR01023938.1~~GHRR01023938.1.p1  ORF type:complete len:154 (-),score=22.80 GHRR01023938.1:841-1302(-)
MNNVTIQLLQHDSTLPLATTVLSSGTHCPTTHRLAMPLQHPAGCAKHMHAIHCWPPVAAQPPSGSYLYYFLPHAILLLCCTSPQLLRCGLQTLGGTASQFLDFCSCCCCCLHCFALVVLLLLVYFCLLARLLARRSSILLHHKAHNTLLHLSM